MPHESLQSDEKPDTNPAPLGLQIFEHTLEAIGGPASESGELASEYRAVVTRLGVA